MTQPVLDEKSLTYVADALVVTAVLAPVRQNWRRRRDRRDGFPLSYYPMFSARRANVGAVVHLVGLTADGVPRLLHHRHAGTGGLNQVRRQIRRRVAAGGAEDLAREAADSVGAGRRRSEVPVVEVQVVTSRHRYDDFFAGDREPLARWVHATAPVRRTLQGRSRP